jgi:hypothetical protein
MHNYINTTYCWITYTILQSKKLLTIN